jgi:hypothetical protein
LVPFAVYLIVTVRVEQGQVSIPAVLPVAIPMMELHHRDGNHTNNRRENLALLHGHCHDAVHGTRCQ